MISTLFAFAVAEPFFRFHIRDFSVAMQENLEPCVRPLAEISKEGILPHNYIAILGDSYAEGAGDWYIQSNRKKHLPFQASHILYEKTGQDVVTFGSSGTGPLRYILSNFPSSYKYINSMTGFTLEKPQKIIIYFYEGNDIFDTLKDLKRLSSEFGVKAGLNEKEIDEYLRVYEENEPHLRRARNFFFLYNFQSGVFVVRSIINWYKYLKNGSQLPSEPLASGDYYKVWIGQSLVSIPDGLHWPEIDKSDDELRLGVLVYKKCVKRLMAQFPEARYGVLYIPSPYSVYRFASDDKNKTSREFSRLVSINSDKICAMIRGAADELEIPFIDSRPRLRKYARHQFIHGPYDWKHFNKLGYEIFAEDLVALNDTMTNPSSPLKL